MSIRTLPDDCLERASQVWRLEPRRTVALAVHGVSLSDNFFGRPLHGAGRSPRVLGAPVSKGRGRRSGADARGGQALGHRNQRPVAAARAEQAQAEGRAVAGGEGQAELR